MLIKSKIKTTLATADGKIEVKIGDIVKVSESLYNTLKSSYAKSFEFIPHYVVSINDTRFKGKAVNAGEVIEVSKSDFISLKSSYFKHFVFIESVEDYKKHIEKASKKVEETQEELSEVETQEESEVNTETIEEEKPKKSLKAKK